MAENRSPTVSILTACYNAAPYLEAAIESVLRQSHSALELVVVDDGSTDGSFSILSAIRDPRLIVIRQDNAGASAARNRAFHASSGAFVCFFDADDIMAPRHVQSLLSRLVSEPGCIALSPWVRFAAAADAVVLPQRPTERDMTGVDWIVADWSAARPMMQSGMFLIPRMLLEEHGGWDDRLSLIDDFELFARLISRAAGVRFASEAGLFYRSDLSGSLSGQKGRKAVESAFLSLMLGTRHLLDAEDSARTRRVCANLLQDFEYTYYPEHPDLRAKMRARVAELGGAELQPDGPPGFHRLRRFTGWKVARQIQRLAERRGWNRAGRSKSGYSCLTARL